MRATPLHGARDIRLESVRDPSIRVPTDAIVRVAAACICGSDLWPYRGAWETPEPRRIGHELVGFVEEVGSGVRTLKPGDFVIAPFAISDNTCVHCRNGNTTSCTNGSWWGDPDRQGLPVDGCQGEYVRARWPTGRWSPRRRHRTRRRSPACSRSRT